MQLDATTKASYDAATTAAARAQVVLDALADPVTVTVYNGSDVEMGTGTMTTPWATRSGEVLTIAEVTSFTVGTTGTPDANWYLRLESGGRYLQASFGLAGSGKEAVWSLNNWTAGQLGTIGTGTITAVGALPPVFTVAPASASISSSGGTIQFTATDANGDTVTYSLPTTRSGITINSSTGLVTVPSSAAGTSGNIVVRASDGTLTTDATCAVTVASGTKWVTGHFLQPDTAMRGDSMTTLNSAIDQMATVSPLICPGIAIIVPWGQVEQSTRGTYTWTNLDATIARIASTGHKAYLKFWWQEFTSSALPPVPQDKSKNYLPDYMLSDGYAYKSETARACKMWLQAPMDDFIRFMQAVAARYDADSRVAWIGVEEGTWGVPVDGSITATDVRSGTLAQARRLVPALKAAFINTPVFLYNNFLGGQADSGLLVQDQVDIGGGIASPDVRANSLTPATAYPSEYNFRWLRGDRWNGSAWVVGSGPDQRMDALCACEKQVNRDMAWTPSLVYQLATAPGTYKPHVMAWSLQTTAYLYGYSGQEAYRIPAMDRAAVLAWFKTQSTATIPLRTDKPSTF